MTTLLRDARFGLRLLRRDPGFTAVAVLALALGIAANTAIFSVIYATYLEPLPLRNADRLVIVWSRVEGNREVVSPADYRDWKRQATVFEDMNAWGWRSVNLAADGRPEQVQAGPATPGFLAMFGYGHPLALGRTFVENEGTPGNDRVVVLTHRLWQERFGGDPQILDREIRIDGKPHTVVGVLGPGPADRNQNRLWLPLAFTPEQLNRRDRWLLVMAVLKPGITIEQANADLRAVAANLAKIYPETNAGRDVSVEPFRNNFVADSTKAALWLLVGAVAFVLLIACANLANLLLARGTARQRELAIRGALGATRIDVLRQLVTESVVLALVGGVLGVAVAYGLVKAIVALLPPFTLPTEVDVRLNVPVLLFTLGVCALSGILFGAAPAWQAARANPNETLKEAGRAPAPGRHGLRRALVILEFALALALLTGGGLAIHNFFKLTSVDVGFRVDRLLTFTLPVSEGRLTGAAQTTAFYRELLQRLHAVPGVQSASVSVFMPLRGQPTLGFSIAGRSANEVARRPRAAINAASPEYFRTLGIRIVRGRGFTDADRTGSQPVALVNEAFVRRYLSGVDPVTQRVVLEAVPNVEQLGSAVERQIVGVYADVLNGGLQNDVLPAIDLPFAQVPLPRTTVAVRTAGEPMSVRQTIAAVVQNMDPDLPIADVETMEQILSDSMATDRFNTALFGGFAAVALLLAAVGIYGVMAFAVARRTHEIGVRMALGAGRRRILAQVLREGMTTSLIGIALGSFGAYYVARSMRGIVPGAGEADSTAYMVVTAMLLGAALVASLLPAARAASVDPMIALRRE
ncbi:MAG TPA: ABC transporter permease [Vicinamibacterales bacterium]|nr:ABC transporter permease [Vicinamibacterales bacterium]